MDSFKFKTIWVALECAVTAVLMERGPPQGMRGLCPLAVVRLVDLSVLDISRTLCVFEKQNWRLTQIRPAVKPLILYLSIVLLALADQGLGSTEFSPQRQVI
jgi:hypothetical protein